MERTNAQRGKNNRSGRVLSVITLVLCAFLAVGVMVLFHACSPKEDGTWMSCHYAQLAVSGLGLAMTVLSLCAVFVKGRVSVFLYVLIMIAAIVAAVIPGNVIHLCMMNEMRCRAIMRPSVILICVFIVVFAFLSLVTGQRSSRTR